MLQIDNLTVVYLIGLVSLSYGVVQALTLCDEFHSSKIWALAQILFSMGFVGLVYFGQDPLPRAWIGCYAILVLAVLTQLTAIARFGQNSIPKIPAGICLVVLALVVILFESTRQLGAPLASLETLLFTPLTVAYVYMAWFSGKLGKISDSLYLKLSSGAFAIYGVLMAITLLISLAGLGQGITEISSTEIRVLSLASLFLSLVTNYLWSIQAAELSQTDIKLVNFSIALAAKANAVPVFVTAPSKKGLMKQARNAVKGDSKLEIKADSKTEEKKGAIYGAISAKVSEKADKANKVTTAKSTETNPESLSADEQAALLARLTEREKEVFMLAADGMRNGQIAQALNSSESSIKVHRSRMTAKLGMSSVENLAKLKKALGLSEAAAAEVAVAVPEVVAESAAPVAEAAPIDGRPNQPPIEGTLFGNSND